MTKMITRKGKVDIALSLLGIDKHPSSETHAEAKEATKVFKHMLENCRSSRVCWKFRVRDRGLKIGGIC